LIQGFVEVIQNALDIMDIEKADVDIYHTFNKMYVTNSGVSLGIEDLDVGQTTKREDVGICLPRGYFGTGLNKAVSTFLRFGYKIVMYSRYGMYLPEVVELPSEKYGKVKRISVSVFDKRIPEGTIIEISGSNIDKIFEDLRDRVVELKRVKLISVPGYPRVQLVDEPVEIDKYLKETRTSGRGYHRGLYICNITTIFNYNFCDRDLMKQESRNSFTDINRLGWQVADFWKNMDNIEYIKKLIEYSMKLGNIYHDESLIQYRKPEEDEIIKLWYKAWCELYPGKGEECKYVTYSPEVVKKSPDKFVLVPEFLYIVLKHCGVPCEDQAKIERVEITRYILSPVERDRLNSAIKIAAFFAGKKSGESIKIKNILEQTLPDKVYSRAVTIDKYGTETDRTGELGFAWKNDIRSIYIRDRTIRDGNELSIAVLILHELAHTKEVGSLYEFPTGFLHEDMHYYYDSIITDIFGMLKLSTLIKYYNELEKTLR
jgi:hypothetical protein